ncbi:hypothetical protein [Embleya sp. NPDC005971]|uniref:hypothetical protein n=1 Tax=Embleya sp. NPDC005971 TaxID=3156724 RepID=UPI0033FC8ECD
MSVHNLSIRLGEVGRQDEGLAAIEEAIEVYRPMAVAIPEVFAGRLRTAQATRASLR